MRTFLKPTEDASIYQRNPTRNTGLDEILEVGKLINELDQTVMYSSASVRSLINFNISSESTYPTSSQYFLNLYIANATNVKRYQTLEVRLISSSWVEGSGYFFQDVINSSDGATWLSAEPTVSWSNAGADYYTSTSASYEISNPILTDMRIDVTNLVAPIVAGTGSFEGFIVKLPVADEEDSTNKANIRFFSGNTHTVYEPVLEIVWPSQQFITGSLKPIQSSNISIIPKNLKEGYTQGEVDKIYLNVRDPYPDKPFYDATQRYKNKYYLPSESYYRIRDEVSGVTLHDFDQYSAINCDASGSYILLDTSDLDLDRFYKIELKIKSNSLVFYPEFEYSFKVDTNG